MNDYKELLVWQKSVELVSKIYRMTKIFPKDELYGLVSQLRRAAVSVPANISEGHSRFHTKEFIQFLYIALGSSSELETLLILSGNLSYITKEKSDLLLSKIIEIRKMLNSLIGSLKRKLKK